MTSKVSGKYWIQKACSRDISIVKDWSLQYGFWSVDLVYVIRTHDKKTFEQRWTAHEPDVDKSMIHSPSTVLSNTEGPLRMLLHNPQNKMAVHAEATKLLFDAVVGAGV